MNEGADELLLLGSAVDPTAIISVDRWSLSHLVPQETQEPSLWPQRSTKQGRLSSTEASMGSDVPAEMREMHKIKTLEARSTGKHRWVGPWAHLARDKIRERP